MSAPRREGPALAGPSVDLGRRPCGRPGLGPRRLEAQLAPHLELHDLCWTLRHDGPRHDVQMPMHRCSSLSSTGSHCNCAGKSSRYLNSLICRTRRGLAFKRRGRPSRVALASSCYPATGLAVAPPSEGGVRRARNIRGRAEHGDVIRLHHVRARTLDDPSTRRKANLQNCSKNGAGEFLISRRGARLQRAEAIPGAASAARDRGGRARQAPSPRAG